MLNSNTPNSSLSYCKFGDEIAISATAAANDNILTGCHSQAQMIYNMAIAIEPQITHDMLCITKRLGTVLVGLEYSVKTASSVKKKLVRMANKALEAGEKPKNDFEYLREIGDLIRYTELVDHNKMADKVRETMLLLEDKGYDVYEIDNKYLNQKGRYKAVHLNAISPSGQIFEIQIHSEETLAAGRMTHKLYEEWRKPETSLDRKAELYSAIKSTYDNLPIPRGIEQVGNYQKAV